MKRMCARSILVAVLVSALWLPASEFPALPPLGRQVALLDANRECVAAGTLMRYVSSSGHVLGRSGQAVA